MEHDHDDHSHETRFLGPLCTFLELVSILYLFNFKAQYFLYYNTHEL